MTCARCHAAPETPEIASSPRHTFSFRGPICELCGYCLATAELASGHVPVCADCAAELLRRMR